MSGQGLIPILDEIQRSVGAHAAAAQRLVSQLSNAEWEKLAAWAVAGGYGPVSGTISFGEAGRMEIRDSLGKRVLRAVLVRGEHKAPGPCILTFSGTEWCVCLDQASFVDSPRALELSPSSLLEAMQVIRDDVDDLLYYPPEMRRSRLQLFAKRTKVDHELFRRLINWLPALLHGWNVQGNHA